MWVRTPFWSNCSTGTNSTPAPMAWLDSELQYTDRQERECVMHTQREVNRPVINGRMHTTCTHNMCNRQSTLRRKSTKTCMRAQSPAYTHAYIRDFPSDFKVHANVSVANRSFIWESAVQESKRHETHSGLWS
jgi:hypothetical protein